MKALIPRRYLEPAGYSRLARRTLGSLGHQIALRTERLRGPSRIQELIPGLAHYSSLARDATETLAGPYGDYVTNVSTPGMAISFELAIFVRVLCDITNPESVIDFGSGFSSYVLRRYATETEGRCAHWSVDNDTAWLRRTSEFLQSNGLAADHLYSWNDYLHLKTVQRFSLILHDLGGMRARRLALPSIFAMALPGAMVILDDANELAYAMSARRLAARSGWRIMSAISETRDSSGRFALIAWNPGRP